jgi:hypothetical protein
MRERKWFDDLERQDGHLRRWGTFASPSEAACKAQGLTLGKQSDLAVRKASDWSSRLVMRALLERRAGACGARSENVGGCSKCGVAKRGFWARTLVSSYERIAATKLWTIPVGTCSGLRVRYLCRLGHIPLMLQSLSIASHH